MNKNHFARLLVSLVICQLAGIVGAMFTVPAIESGWYESLVKPDFSPPNWVFGPVWIILYLLMGVAFYLIWSSYAKASEGQVEHKKQALIIFGIQLILNTVWSIIFFGLQNPGLAFFEIIILWLAILVVIFSFYRISKAAAFLLIPYILWVSFASFLNFSIWQLNSGKDCCSFFSEEQARAIAEQSCIKGGESLLPGYYNENTKTWWFDANLNSVKSGCSPACVVFEETKIAEINWRCTGLLRP